MEQRLSLTHAFSYSFPFPHGSSPRTLQTYMNFFILNTHIGAKRQHMGWEMIRSHPAFIKNEQKSYKSGRDRPPNKIAQQENGQRTFCRI